MERQATGTGKRATIMYAVIKTGGKQARVTEGERLDVELLGQPVGSDITLTPILVVDGDYLHLHVVAHFAHTVDLFHVLVIQLADVAQAIPTR